MLHVYLEVNGRRVGTARLHNVGESLDGNETSYEVVADSAAYPALARPAFEHTLSLTGFDRPRRSIWRLIAMVATALAEREEAAYQQPREGKRRTRG